jgi:hypothetical protein
MVLPESLGNGQRPSTPTGRPSPREGKALDGRLILALSGHGCKCTGSTAETERGPRRGGAGAP